MGLHIGVIFHLHVNRPYESRLMLWRDIVTEICFLGVHFVGIGSLHDEEIVRDMDMFNKAGNIIVSFMGVILAAHILCIAF